MLRSMKTRMRLYTTHLACVDGARAAGYSGPKCSSAVQVAPRLRRHVVGRLAEPARRQQ